MNPLLKLIWQIISQRAKYQGAVAYLRVIQGSRQIVVVILLTAFLMHAVALSFLGVVMSGVWLLDIAPENKLWILFGTFLGFFVILTVALVLALSERVWFKASGAEKIVDFLRKGA